MLAKVGQAIRHLFTPHHSNNFRAKLLHNTGYVALVGIVLSINLLVRILESSSVHILGFESSVTIQEVVALTNQERIAAGLPALTYNEKLADAARRKAANMFEENYWAHNSPTGKSPWVWFQAAGYKYAFAGENLGKDFASTDRLVAAWMSSPTHKKNILSDKFTEIGIAVVPGTLLDKDTVLVVQHFGNVRGGQVASVATVDKPTPREEVSPTIVPSLEIATTPVEIASTVPGTTPIVAELKELRPREEQRVGWLAGISSFDFQKIASLATTALLIIVLLFDVLVAESRKISRRVGKNWAHLVYVNVILILITIANAGSIL